MFSSARTREEEKRMAANIVTSRAIDIEDPSAEDVEHATGGKVGKGTVFVQSFVLADLAGVSWDETDSHGSWIAFRNEQAERVKKELIDAGRSVFADNLIEAGAFGCDSRVLDRAVDRALQHASDNGVDLLEIMEVVARHDSGIEYIEILARGRRIRIASADENTSWDPGSIGSSFKG